MINKQNLEDRIIEEKRLLDFYVRYEDDIIKMTSKREWKLEVDECLDCLNELYDLLKSL